MASLVCPPSSDPFTDAEALRKACDGWGTNEHGVIEIIAHRNAAQLKQIKEAYYQQCNEDLIVRLQKELSGDFGRAVYLWMLEPFDREAFIINEAIKKGDYKVVVELTCVSSPDDLFRIRRAYQLRYKHSLEEDVACNTNGDVRKLLLLLVSAYRYEATETDSRLVQSEAEILYKAIKDKEYNDEEVLRIVTTRSKAHLVAVVFRYEDAYGDSLSKHLEEKCDEKYVALLNIAVSCLKSTKEYLEGVIRGAMEQHGTDEDTLSRVIVTRAEKDLGEIKEFYFQRNGVTLEQAVSKETHWDYKPFLLALLGAEGH